MPNTYDVDGIRELKENKAVPIIIFDELDNEEKKIRLFDTLGQYQAQKYITFVRYPGNDKLAFEVYPREALFQNFNLIYALVPISVQTVKDLLDNEYNR